MFRTFFQFEIRYWLRGMMVYIFLLVIALMIFGAVSSDNVIVGRALENTDRNAPFVIQNFYAVMSLLTSLMITAFVNSAASRDFMYNTAQIVYTKPIDKSRFLLGRFWGSTLVALIPMLGVSLGVIVGAWMPWNDAERWGPISWWGHFWGFVVFAVPNTIFFAAVVFALAIWTRSTISSFIGILVLLVAYSIAGAMLGDLENETLAKLADPLGINAFNLATKYWTVADRNTRYVTLQGDMLVNRLIWLAAGMGILGWAIWRFSFAERSRGRPWRVEEEPLPTAMPVAVAAPPVTLRFESTASWLKLWSQIRLDVWGIVKSNVFIVIMLAGFINAMAALIFNATEGFGLTALPVTYHVIDIVRGSLTVFIAAVITFYAGVLVWRERDSRIDEVYDALPVPTWMPYVSKFLALTLVLVGVLSMGILAGVVTQACEGYFRFQWSLYVVELLCLDLTRFLCLIVLAFLAHVISPNKYMGYFLFIVMVIANSFGWSLLRVDSALLRYGQLPGHVYSDLYGFAPYRQSLIWFAAYWLLFASMIAVATMMLWQRGRETGWRARLREWGPRFRGSLRWVAYGVVCGWSLVAVWVYYNTRVLNEMRSPRQSELLQVRYEEQLKAHEAIVQPRVTQVRFEIDLVPEKRQLTLRGQQQLVNASQKPIEQIHLSLADRFETTVEIDRATLDREHEELNYQIYRIDPPLLPGESIGMRYTVRHMPKGFESSLAHPQIVQNGTFFNSEIAPQLGYQSDRELRNRNRRKKFNLGEPRRMPELSPDDLARRGENYLGNSADWVDVETIMSTSPDQIAVAPGSLVRTWEENGRRYFHYRLDHASLLFFSFISGRFEVRREKWNDVDIEIYYHPEHAWNVPNMLRSVAKSLEYYTREFGPYRHRQARIIEFPRIAEFAQAFAGTMPYGEGIGFIANLKDPEDIDMVFYVVAHEMAHQWWAHQIIGANMQGATTLSETLAQYSALMVMEREFGRDIMRKFLRYEMDNYLSSRGRELLQEPALLRVESDQGYVHYRKGSVVMYQIKELIGEEKVNAALRSLVRKFGYQQPPYPTSQDLLDALREQAPAEYHTTLEDLFERITLYSNRVLECDYKRLASGKYRVRLKVDCRKFVADPKGNEAEVPLDDWVEIGAFAKPESGKKYGATLYRERVRVTQPVNEFTFEVDQEPDRVGVDPFHLLIDRVPDDNVKKVRPDATKRSSVASAPMGNRRLAGFEPGDATSTTAFGGRRGATPDHTGIRRRSLARGSRVPCDRRAG